MVKDVEQATKEVIAGHLQVEAATLNRDTALDELGVNSLQLTEIVMDLEDMFDISIDQNAAEAWASLKTVGDVVDAVQVMTTAKA